MNLFASIDIGTHSAQLLIAGLLVQDQNTQIIPKSESIHSVKLGLEMSAENPFIAQSSLERLKTALLDFRKTIHFTGAQLKCIVLTQACRQAQNQDEVLQIIRDIFSFEAQIISGELESMWCWQAIAHLHQTQDFVMIDVGAGSTEISDGTFWLSHPEGALSLSAEHGVIPNENLHKILIKKFKDYALKNCFKKKLYLSGGSAAILGALILDLKSEDIENSDKTTSSQKLEGLEISLDDIQMTITRLSQISADLRAQLPGLGSGRSHIIIPGLFMIRALVQFFQPTQILLSVQGLCLGALVHSLGLNQGDTHVINEN
jgi:exopolyphosphatase/guanosine-5'-triphosphate,3'-diphosphate pyrophosphatase